MVHHPIPTTPTGHNLSLKGNYPMDNTMVANLEHPANAPYAKVTLMKTKPRAEGSCFCLSAIRRQLLRSRSSARYAMAPELKDREDLEFNFPRSIAIEAVQSRSRAK